MLNTGVNVGGLAAGPSTLDGVPLMTSFHVNLTGQPAAHMDYDPLGISLTKGTSPEYTSPSKFRTVSKRAKPQQSPFVFRS